MMSRLTDSSELKEAVSLFHDLFGDGSPGVSGTVGRNLGVSPAIRAPQEALKPEPPPASVTAFTKPVTAAPMPAIEGEFRGDKLENVLIAMCQRGQFIGAVISDIDGLPLAVHNSPVDVDNIAAFTSILGDALSKAGRYLEQHGADYISMDINYEDKIVVRQFSVGSFAMYIMVMCAQETDERSEVELSIQQIVSIIG